MLVENYLKRNFGLHAASSPRVFISKILFLIIHNVYATKIETSVAFGFCFKFVFTIAEKVLLQILQ